MTVKFTPGKNMKMLDPTSSNSTLEIVNSRGFRPKLTRTSAHATFRPRKTGSKLTKVGTHATFGSRGFRPKLTRTFEDALDAILFELRTLMLSKQADYGHNNILEFGKFGVLLRANDKMARLKHLAKKAEAPKNESVEDSWRDLANYSIISLMLDRGTFQLPLKEDLI